MTTEPPKKPREPHVTINSATPSHITSLHLISKKQTNQQTHTTDITGDCTCLCNNEFSSSAGSVMLYSNNSAGRYEMRE